jgi:hypothetical protein
MISNSSRTTSAYVNEPGLPIYDFSFSIYLLLIACLYLRPFELLTPDLGPYRPMLILIGLALVSTAASSFADDRVRPGPTPWRLLIAFFLAIMLSQLQRSYMAGTFNAIEDFGPSAAVLALTFVHARDQRKLEVTAVVYAVLILSLSIVSLWSYHTGVFGDLLLLRQGGASPASEGALYWESDIPAEDNSGLSLWRIRGPGFLNDPNDLGQAIVAAMPFIVVALDPRKSAFRFLIAFCCTAVLIYAIYLTRSRGATVALAVMLVAIGRSKFGNVAAIITGGIVATAALMLDFSGGRSYSIREESAGGRLEAWADGLHMLADYPLFGVGYGSFLEHHQRVAHNSFVQAFAELGLVGYFIWIGLLMTAGKCAWHVSVSSEATIRERQWANAILLSLLGFLTCSLFLSRTFSPTQYLLVGLAFATLAGQNSKVSGLPLAPQQVKWVIASGIALALSIFGTHLAVRFYYTS